MIISPIFVKNQFNKSSSQKNIFDGVVLLEINSKLFFENAIGSDVPSDTSIVFEIVDKDTKNMEFSVFTSKNIDLLKSNYKPFIKSEQSFNIVDREIKIKFYTIPNFGGQFQEYLPYLSFVISIILSVLFFLQLQVNQEL